MATPPQAPNHSRPTASGHPIDYADPPSWGAHAPRSGHWRWALGTTAVVGCLVVFFNLGGYRTLTTHEGFVVVTARGMLESGDWVVPRFAGIPRLQKPPLAYWTVAGSAVLMGELSEWTARLPSALAALLLSLLMGHWAAGWYGRTAGLATAIVQLTSVYTLSFARLAEVDILLCLVTTWALYIFAQAATGTGPSRPPESSAGLPGQLAEKAGRSAFRGKLTASGAWVLFWALLGVSWLAKFHYGPSMVMAAAVGYCLIERRPQLLAGMLFCPAGWLVFGLCLAVWPWLLLRALPNAWEMWTQQTWGRAVGELGTEPIWYYLPHVVSSTLPWAPLWILAVPESWRKAWRGGCPRERLLWVWFVTQFALLHLSSSKHHHYLMAALPALSLIGGRRLATIVQHWQSREACLPYRYAAGAWIAYQLLAVAAGTAIAARWPNLATAGLVVALIIAAGGTLLIWMASQGQVTRALYASAVVSVLLLMAVYGWIMPGRDRRLAAAQFARTARAVVGPDEPIYTFRMGQDPMTYYLGAKAARRETMQSIRLELENRGSLVVLTRPLNLPQLQTLGRPQILRGPRSDRYPGTPSGPPLALVRLTSLPPATDSR